MAIIINAHLCCSSIHLGQLPGVVGVTVVWPCRWLQLPWGWEKAEGYPGDHGNRGPQERVGHCLSPQSQCGQCLGIVVFCHPCVSHNHTSTLTWGPEAYLGTECIWSGMREGGDAPFHTHLGENAWGP